MLSILEMSLLYFDKLATTTTKLLISTLVANPGGLNELEFLREVHDNHGIDIHDNLLELEFSSLKEFIQITTVEDINNQSNQHLGNKTVNLTNIIEIQEIDLETRRPFPIGKTFYKLKDPNKWKSLFHKRQLNRITNSTVFKKEFDYVRKYDDILNFNRFHYEEKCHEIVNDVSLQANFDTTAPKCDFIPYKLRMNVRHLLMNDRIVEKLAKG